MPGGGGVPGGNCMKDIALGGRLGGGRFSSFCISWDDGINGGGIYDGGNPPGADPGGTPYVHSMESLSISYKP